MSDVEASTAAHTGDIKPETQLTHEILLAQGVPESALGCVGKSVTSTYEEAVAVETWARQNRIISFNIPTDEFHTRRVKWLFGKRLKP